MSEPDALVRGDVVERLDQLFEGVLRGRGGGLAIRGAIGIGVTSLLDHARDRAIGLGVRTASARGRPEEQHHDGAVLQELANSLPELERVHASADPSGAVLRALRDLDQPTLVIVDDVDLGDRVSIGALGFALHRIAAAPVALLLGGRIMNGPATPPPITLGDWPTVLLEPLDERDLMMVLRAHLGGRACDSTLRAIARLAGGTPLAAIEMARQLRPDQLDGSAPWPTLPSLGGGLGQVFAAPLRELPEATRRALCVAAAEPTGEIRTIGLALSTLGEPTDVLEPAEERTVIEIVDGIVRFDHPLRRAAAYHLLAAPSRRAAHRALALACDAPEAAERRAAHLDAGTVLPDASIAEDLERVARHAERRGDTASARHWWNRAAQLSPDGRDAARRRAAARQVAGHGPSDGLGTLTPAERRVALVVGTGMSNKEAALALRVSVKTVDAHLQAIYRKLDLRSRTELAVLIGRETTNSVDDSVEATG